MCRIRLARRHQLRPRRRVAAELAELVAVGSDSDQRLPSKGRLVSHCQSRRRGVWLRRDGTLEPFLLRWMASNSRQPTSSSLTRRTGRGSRSARDGTKLAWRRTSAKLRRLVDARGAQVSLTVFSTNESESARPATLVVVKHSAGGCVAPLSADNAWARTALLNIDRGLPDGFAFDDAGGLWSRRSSTTAWCASTRIASRR